MPIRLAGFCRKISRPGLGLGEGTNTTDLTLCIRRSQFRSAAISVSCLEEALSYGPHYLPDHQNPEISCFCQKGFSKITSVIVGKALHALCIKGSVPTSTYYTNTLINMYSKLDHIECARYVFDRMLDRNEASWNHMMSGFVRACRYREAMRFFCETCRIGVKPSGYLIASLLTACGRSECMVQEGLQVHGIAIKYGLFDVFVGTSLLHLYGTYGLVSNANKIFEEMPERNVVSWTSLMVGYSDNGEMEEVINLYQCMRRDGLYCNENTFATVISSCGMLDDELLGHHVLGHAIKSGFDTNVSVGNSLISMFSCHGKISEASYVFDSMCERDTVSWNSIIAANAHNDCWKESFIYFCWMRCANKEINSITLSTLLSSCGSVYNLKWGEGIHGLVVKFGLESNVTICNNLLNMYSETGKSEEAELIFNKMPERDLITWNSMMVCYVEDGKFQNVLQFFSYILRMRKVMNYVTFVSALAACSNHDYIAEGKIVHALLILSGLHRVLIVGNALVTMYGKSGLMREARLVCESMPNRDVVTWNALIGCYAENGDPSNATEAFKFMKKEGAPVNYITIVNILGACLTPDNLLKHGRPIHALIVVTGFELDTCVQSALITMYSKCGDLNSSNYIFGGLANKNSSSWNAIVAANALYGLGEEALKLIVKIRDAGLDLDQFSFSVAFAVTANLAMLDEGQQLHSLVIKLGFDADLFVRNSAMDMYGKCGELNDVFRMLPQPSNRLRLSWNILISALARHGNFQQARETFNEMLTLGVQPDHVTFVSLLSACSHGGMVDEGLAHYALMTTEFRVPAGIEHCVCIVDLLGRSGRLAEAEAFINDMPVPPNDLVWRSFLAACKVHGNLELGRKAAKQLLEMDSLDDSAYVLYSNVCASTRRWEDVENVRKQMESRDIKKKPACSWVKLKNKVTSFGMGDHSHPQTGQIFAKLRELNRLLKEAGYVPDTSNSLQDTDEEQKEHNLWNHSERIALAFALINTPQGSPLRIFKNLRVCVDCHSVYKFVSKILGRKIILRDPYRFHHFCGGQCSCSDYW